MWVKPLRYASSPTARELLVGVWGDNAITSAAESGLFAAAIRDTGQISVIWENNGASTGGWRDTEAYVRLNRWYKIDFVAVPNGANLDLSIYINGERADLLENIQRSAGGSNSDFYVGGIKQGVSSTLRGNFEMCGLYFWDRSLEQKDIIEDFRRGFLGDVSYQESAKAEIEDQSNTFVDISDLDGVDAFAGFSMSENVDTQTQTLTLSIARDNGKKSMSPLRTDSLHNLSDKADPLSFSEIIRKGAGVKVSTARSAWGIEPETDEFIEIFDGQIVTASFSSDPISVECADNSTVLVNTFIEENYIYGEQVKTSDGGVIVPAGIDTLQDVIQEVLDDNDNFTQNIDRPGRYGSYDPITLVVDEDPDYALEEYIQRREPVYSAISTLADQIGWVVRYQYRNDLADWALTLYDPIPVIERRGYVIGKKDIIEITNADIDSVNVRNSIKIIYGSREPFSGDPLLRPDINNAGLIFPGSWVATNGNSGPDNHGNKTPAFVTIENRDSIDKYGRLHSEISEDATSQIDTVVEAGRLAISFLESLSEPLATIDVKIPYSPHYEIGDKVLIEGGNNIFTDNQDLAIVSKSHSIGPEESTTTLSLRGKPSSGFKKWLRLEARPGVARPGTQLGDQSLPDRRRGDLISGTRSQYENSDQFSGGKFLAVRNSDFQLMTRGDRFTPDGWTDLVGTQWNFNVEPDKATSFSGTQSIRFDGSATSSLLTTGGIKRGLHSDIIPILGENNTPHSFECVWLHTDTSGVDPLAPKPSVGIGLEVIWYAGDKITQLGTPEYISFGDKMGANNWNFSRIDGVSAPTGTRFCKILVGCLLSAGSAECYVDSVVGYREAQKFLANQDKNSAPLRTGVDPVHGVQGNGTSLVVFNSEDDITITDGVDTIEQDGFDHGMIFEHHYDGSPTGPSNAFNEFTAPEDGVYEYSYSVIIENNSAVTYEDVTASIVKNADYDAYTLGVSFVQQIDPFGSAGERLTKTINSSFFTPQVLLFKEKGRVQLQQGDVVSLVMYNNSSTTYVFRTSPAEPSHFSMALRVAD